MKRVKKEENIQKKNSLDINRFAKLKQKVCGCQTTHAKPKKRAYTIWCHLFCL